MPQSRHPCPSQLCWVAPGLQLAQGMGYMEPGWVPPPLETRHTPCAGLGTMVPIQGPSKQELCLPALFPTGHLGTSHGNGVAAAGGCKAETGPPRCSQPLIASRRPALPPHLHLIYSLEPVGPRGMAVVGAAARAVLPPAEGGEPGPSPTRCCRSSRLLRPAGSTELAAVWAGDSGASAGDVAGGWLRALPGACQPGRRWGSARRRQPEPRPSEVLPAEAQAGRSRAGQPWPQLGRGTGPAACRHRRTAWGQGPRSVLGLPWHVGGSGPTARLQLPSCRAQGCPRVLGPPESSPAAGQAASRAGTAVILAPTSSVLGAQGWGWHGPAVGTAAPSTAGRATQLRLSWHGCCQLPCHWGRGCGRVQAVPWLQPLPLHLPRGACTLRRARSCQAPQPCGEEGRGQRRTGWQWQSPHHGRRTQPIPASTPCTADGSAALGASTRLCTAPGTPVPGALAQPCPRRSRMSGPGHWSPPQ